MLTWNTVIKLFEANDRKQTIAALKKCIAEGEPVNVVLTAKNRELVIEQNRILNKYMGDTFNRQEVSDLIAAVYHKKVSKKVEEKLANRIMWNLYWLTPLADPQLVDREALNFMVYVKLSREVGELLDVFYDRLSNLSQWVDEQPESAIGVFNRLAKEYLFKKKLLLSQTVYGGK